jgi:hypothetical protein
MKKIAPEDRKIDQKTENTPNRRNFTQSGHTASNAQIDTVLSPY